jgi:hypothetical protein
MQLSLQSGSVILIMRAPTQIPGSLLGSGFNAPASADKRPNQNASIEGIDILVAAYHVALLKNAGYVKATVHKKAVIAYL